MRAGQAGAPQMDAIRSQLRALGYLRGPLGGWMLPRGGPSSFLKVNLVSSLYVGLLGGPVLGLPAAWAVALSNRPHLSNPVDLLTLGLYLSVMLGGALVVLQLAADSLLAFLARRGLVLVGAAERLAGRVGLLFTVAAALYLAAVLRGGGLAGADRTAPLAWLIWAAAVLLALAAGHVIGRLTRLSSLVALLAASDGLMVKPVGSSRWRIRALPLAAGLVLGLCVVLILMPRDGTSTAAVPMPAVVAAPSSGRIVVVGLDGLDAPLLDRSARSGLIPNIARLERDGARLDLATSAPPVPPKVWTTIATGLPPERHGVLGFQSARLPGISARIQEPGGRAILSPRLLIPPLAAERAPVSGGLRRAPAVWEIASDAGLTSACLNWWATWPARGGAGAVVSERAFARLEAGLPPDREINPPELQEELVGSFEADLREAKEHARRAADIAPGDDQVSVSAAIDGYHALLARRLLARRSHRVLMLYLPGLDLVRTSAGGPSQPGSEDSVERSLRHVDALLGQIAGELDPADTLLVVCEPGRSHGWNSAPDGVVLAVGTRVRPGRIDARATPLDIAPTILAMSGLPLAKDQPGAPVRAFLPPEDVAWRLPADVQTYGTWADGPTEDEGGEFDEELLDRLRSLGYIQ